MQKRKLSQEAQAFLQGIIARTKQAREEVCPIQRQFAIEYLKIHYNTYRSREGNMFDLDAILKLNSELGYHIKWLLTGEGPKGGPKKIE